MIMSIPIQERREFIRRHNDEQAREKSELKAKDGEATSITSDVNTYAEIEQANRGLTKGTHKGTFFRIRK